MTRRLLLIGALALCACHGDGDPGATRAAGDCVAAEPGSDAGRPPTIPALREWRAGTGMFQFRDDTQLVVATPALADIADAFAADWQLLTGRPLALRGDARPGDIALDLGDCDARLGREGYRLTAGETLRVHALEPAGVFMATRTILQLRRQGTAIAAGEALDWPRYPERGLMVDIGRKHFDVGWLRSHVRELAYLKLNTLHLHFSENLGFRIESVRHPEIVSAEHLTQQQLRDLVALAARHFITVIPEIDMPSHMGAALAAHPEFQLTDLLGQRSTDHLDITNPAAVQFARELIEEFLPLFPGPFWHTGADEYLGQQDYPRYPQLEAQARERYGATANAKDAVHGFTNDIDDVVRGHGRTTRIWHDDANGGAAVTLHPELVVEWWTNFSPLGDLVLVPTPQELLERGHTIANAGWFPTYYVVGGAFGAAEGVPPVADMAIAYEDWEPHEFYGPLYAPFAQGTLRFPPETIAADEPRNLGANLHLWCDGPDAETQDEVAASIGPRLRVIAQKTWGSARLTPAYADFLPISDAIGHAPGWE